MAMMGFCELELDVPLFAELYGYGPFLGRRNTGVRDPLHCRAIVIGDGSGKRIVLVVSELVVTDDVMARSLRAELAAEYSLHPNGIMFGGVHTHSGPAVSMGIGWGEIAPEFMNTLRSTIKKAVGMALADMEEITAESGVVPLSQKVGTNRVFADGQTDETIRWIRFRRADDSVKLLLYNHGMHGVVFGARMMRVSADWSGEVNRLVKERKLADNVMFVYGAAGNINTEPCCLDEEHGDPELRRIGKSLADDLENGLAAGGKELKLDGIGFVLEQVEMPIQVHTPEQMREFSAFLADKNKFLSDRLREMALLVENQKRKLQVIPDLQIIRAGDFAVYGFPGEPFVELGKRIMAESEYPFAICSTVTNGNCRYFPTRETFEKFPDGFKSENRGYGFYEIHQGSGRFMPPYQPDIADFIVNKFLSMKAN